MRPNWKTWAFPKTSNARLVTYQKQLFCEPFSQHSRSLKLRELPARFFGGLSNRIWSHSQGARATPHQRCLAQSVSGNFLSIKNCTIWITIARR